MITASDSEDKEGTGEAAGITTSDGKFSKGEGVVITTSDCKSSKGEGAVISTPARKLAGEGVVITTSARKSSKGEGDGEGVVIAMEVVVITREKIRKIDFAMLGGKEGLFSVMILNFV